MDTSHHCMWAYTCTSRPCIFSVCRGPYAMNWLHIKHLVLLVGILSQHLLYQHSYVCLRYVLSLKSALGKYRIAKSSSVKTWESTFHCVSIQHTHQGSSAFGANYSQSKCERLSGAGSHWHSSEPAVYRERDNTWTWTAQGSALRGNHTQAYPLVSHDLLQWIRLPVFHSPIRSVEDPAGYVQAVQVWWHTLFLKGGRGWETDQRAARVLWCVCRLDAWTCYRWAEAPEDHLGLYNGTEFKA